MSEWPEGWSRGSGQPPGRRPGSGSGPDDATRAIPPSRPSARTGPPADATRVMPASGLERAPQRGAHPPPPFGPTRRRRSGRGRPGRVLRRFLLAVVLIAALLIGLMLFF